MTKENAVIAALITITIILVIWLTVTMDNIRQDEIKRIYKIDDREV